MCFKANAKVFVKNSCQLFWWAQQYLRFGTFSPSIRSIKPTASRVFVLGNGPSLTKDIAKYTEQLAREDLVMVNQSLTSPLGFELKPRYYVLMDPVYFGTLPGYYGDENLVWVVPNLIQALERVDWKMKLFVPYHEYKRAQNKIDRPSNNKQENVLSCINPNVEILTFNAVELYTFKHLARIMYSHNLAVPSGINVLIVALSCMIALGYEYIYLLGANSDWHKNLEVDSQNKVFMRDTHFYQDISDETYVPYTFAFIMQCMTDAFRAYQELGEVFPQKIINCSSNSMIDAFPRVSLESILGGGGEVRKSIFLFYYSFVLPTNNGGYHVKILS